MNYDRFKKVWVAEELYPDAAKCWKPREGKYEHVPKGDVGRLLRAARRWNERKLPVD